MKKLNLSNCATILAGAALLACASANAQTTTVTIDENGNVTSDATYTGIGAFLNAGTTTADLGGFGLGYTGSVLSYAWSAASSPLSPVQGFYNIYNGSVAPGNLIDVIQFLNDGPSYILDFSAVSGSTAYDPTDLSTVLANEDVAKWGPTVDLIEGMCGVTSVIATGPNGPTAYPGFMDHGGTITYTFDTGSAYCPDGGATFGLLGLSLFVIAAVRRSVASRGNALLS
jgi:hypothetical protein